MQATKATFDPTAEADVGYGQLLGVLLRRRFWLLGVLAATLGIAALYSLRQKPVYVSSMQLLVEPNYQGKPGKGLENEFSDAGVQIDNATQVSLMQSSSLLQKAVDQLQFSYPEFSRNNPRRVAQLKAAINVDQVAEDTGGKKGAETKIFQITYQSNDAEKTQKVLKAVQKVYLEYNREQQKLRLTRGLAFVDEQLPQIQNKVQQSENALKQFRRDRQLIDPNLQARTQTDSLNRILQEQQTNNVQLRELASRYASLQRQIQLSPAEAVVASRLSQSSRFQSLLNEIQKSELILEQQRTRFKDQTPYVQQIMDQRQRQLGLLQTEVQRVLGDRSISANGGREGILSQGQLSSLDLSLVNQLVETQINLQTAQARFQSLATIEQRLRAELQQFPELLNEYGRLQPEIELNRDTLKQLLKAQQDIGLEIARGGFDWQIVEEPQLGANTSPGMMRNLLLGGVAGLLLGGVAAFAREAADDAVHSLDDLRKQVPVPLLGMVPQVVSTASEEDQPLLNIPLNLPFGRPHSLTPSIANIIQWQPFRESIDLLYQNIQLISDSHSLKSLVITSALAGEGKSTLVLALAISAARLHQRVLLIDADLRRPSLHQLLNLPNDRGLSTFLTSNAPLPKQLPAQAGTPRSNISLITAGPPPDDPAKLLSSHRMKELITTFEQSYDLVLVDTPPVLGMVDAMLTAACCNGVIMVGRIDRVTRAELTQATTMLNKLNVIGVVANGSPYQSRSNVHYQRQSPVTG
jgi:capsular exopolysaccharide synthesis family protein